MSPAKGPHAKTGFALNEQQLEIISVSDLQGIGGLLRGGSHCSALR